MALDTIKVEEPTVSMVFKINTSPFAGKEGKFVTSRNLRVCEDCVACSISCVFVCCELVVDFVVSAAFCCTSSRLHTHALIPGSVHITLAC